MNEQKYSFWNNLKNDWPLFILFLATLGFSFYVYPDLPDRMPTHWNIRGEVDGWSSKQSAILFFPLLNIGVWLLLLVTPIIDPKKANYPQFIKTYKWIRWAIVVTLLLIGNLTILVPLGYNIDIGKAVRGIISILFIILGNYFGKIKHNYFLGIRTPWTLANEQVWKKTHRMAGFLWVAAGILGLIGLFLSPEMGFYVFFGSIMVITLGSTIYSYIVYSKITKA